VRNIRLTLSYHGANFQGWQVQPKAPSIQAAVEEAIFRLTREKVRILGAGRTDAGVHAVGQVASFRTHCRIPIEKFRLALQTYLPRDIVLQDVAEVPESFHATYSARRKLYRYVIHNRAIANPFLRELVWQIRDPLDEVAMNVAARDLLGTQDFRCFESHYPNKATSVRTVFRAEFRRAAIWSAWDAAGESPGDVPSSNSQISSSGVRGELAGRPLSQPSAQSRSEGEFLLFDIEADGFLYNMVRAIVGTLHLVGRGDWPTDSVRRVIEQQDRALAGPTAPPQGLYLMRVDYPEDDLLPPAELE